jgi:proteasome lid subunit RPN8/RPN11
MTISEKTTVSITADAYTKIKMNSYRSWPKEWGGLLIVQDGKITDVIELKHTASTTYFEIDDDNLADLMIDMMEKNPEKLKQVKGWVHCHPMIGWSVTDNSTFIRLLEHFGDYCIGIVDQFAENIRVRVDMRDRLGKVNSMDELDYNIVDGSVPEAAQ